MPSSWALCPWQQSGKDRERSSWLDLVGAIRPVNWHSHCQTCLCLCLLDLGPTWGGWLPRMAKQYISTLLSMNSGMGLSTYLALIRVKYWYLQFNYLKKKKKRALQGYPWNNDSLICIPLRFLWLAFEEMCAAHLLLSKHHSLVLYFLAAMAYKSCSAGKMLFISILHSTVFRYNSFGSLSCLSLPMGLCCVGCQCKDNMSWWRNVNKWAKK